MDATQESRSPSSTNPRLATQQTTRPQLLVQAVEQLLSGDVHQYAADARHKPLWHEENFSHFLKGQDHKVVPVTAEFWPSLSCNARCGMCPYRVNQARSKADTSATLELASLATAERVAHDLATLGVKSALLTGGGEPFMNPQIGHIAKIMREAGLRLGVYSNGTLPDIADRIRSVLSEGQPAFVRLSVNASSEETHRKEYRIKPQGDVSAWEQLKRNSVAYMRTIDELGLHTGFSFSFVLLGDETAEQFRGMAQFLKDVHQRHPFKFMAHFRPKFWYYDSAGHPVPEVPERYREGIAKIPDMVEEHVRPILEDTQVTAQVNGYAINVVAEGRAKPQPCFSTGWATSVNHLGEGYIISELCGSQWPDTKWGTQDESLAHAWQGAQRISLQQRYSSGQILAPVYHKLYGLNESLARFRQIVGDAPFSDQEVTEFWQGLKTLGVEKPRGWDFV